MDSETKRQIIMDNYLNPFHKQIPEGKGYEKVKSHNPSCIDNIDIYILMDKNIIKDITFEGEACAITTSSVSIMIQNLIGKEIGQALEIITNFENMIEEREYNSDILEEANVYDEIYKQQNRKNCVLLPYRDIKKLLEEKNEE